METIKINEHCNLHEEMSGMIIVECWHEGVEARIANIKKIAEKLESEGKTLYWDNDIHALSPGISDGAYWPANSVRMSAQEWAEEMVKDRPQNRNYIIFRCDKNGNRI